MPAASDHHGHDHAPVITTSTSKPHLWGALALLVAFMAGEVVAAYLTGSLALLTDAFHMLSDVLAITAALWALSVASRPASTTMTYGWRRAEILSAAGNGLTLVVVALFLGYEAIHRLIEPPPVDGGPVLVVALVGVAVNLVATWLLARANRSSLNVEGAYQHILTDLYAFIGTALAAAVIIATGWVRADAVASLVVCLIMLRSGWTLVREATWILLEAAPSGCDVEEIRRHLLSKEHVRDVHDLHVWTVTSGLPALSCHVVVEDRCFETGHAADTLALLQECLRGHFDVAHSTFQLEPARMAGHDLVPH